MNPTETNCCRRCQSDSGTCCVLKCCTGNSYTLAESNLPSSSQSIHYVLTLDMCRHTVHWMTSDVLFFGWSFRKATWLLLCCLSEFYSMKHVTHVVLSSCLRHSSHFCSQPLTNLSLCLVPLGDLYVNYTPTISLLWESR